ncbi:Uu.00g023940.m01.CDS01 [Anthostomella pinea]|uniref:Uu.00g023940.m01.CDS01 n=1 Tax=Anthostomella pinea TaxID=933095 RepID=A0AAI8W0N8_9PEZI|nr:Uu.00g023940.m01.CDS01 [Anthostomella pinea]
MPLSLLTIASILFAGTNASALTAREAAATVTINHDQRYQMMDGFGCSDAFQRAVQLSKVTEAQELYALDLLFGTTKGAGLSILRNGIGSSPDMSAGYMVSIQPTSPGGPTSAPKRAYADYLGQSVQHYQEANVTITHLGFVNEPDLTSLRVNALLRDPSSRLHQGARPDPPKGQPERRHQLLRRRGMEQPVGHAGARSVDQYLSTITAHSDTSSHGSPLNTRLRVWQTEAAALNGNWQAAWYSSGGTTSARPRSAPTRRPSSVGRSHGGFPERGWVKVSGGGGLNASVATAFLTDDTHDFNNTAVSVSGGVASASAPGRATVSIVLRHNGSDCSYWHAVKYLPV